MGSLKCGTDNSNSQEGGNGKRSTKKLGRIKRKRSILPLTQRKRRVRFSRCAAGAIAQRACGEDWGGCDSSRAASQGDCRSGKIASHLISECKSKQKRNKAQIARNKQNIKFLESQIAQLKQEQIELAQENERLDLQISSLGEIDSQMAADE